MRDGDGCAMAICSHLVGVVCEKYRVVCEKYRLSRHGEVCSDLRCSWSRTSKAFVTLHQGVPVCLIWRSYKGLKPIDFDMAR